MSKAGGGGVLTEGFRLVRRKPFAQAAADLDNRSETEGKAYVELVFAVVSVVALCTASPAHTRNGGDELLPVDQFTQLPCT